MGRKSSNCGLMINLRLGLDVGSTTVKLVVLNSFYQTVYSIYKRHYSDVKSGIREVILGPITDLKRAGLGNSNGSVVLQHKWLDIPFVQKLWLLPTASENCCHKRM